MKEYPIEVTGFEGQQIAVRTPSFFADAELLLDGDPAPRGTKRRSYVLRNDAGDTVPARLHVVFLDPVPQVEIDNRLYQAVPPFRWYEWFWSALPMVLMLSGDLIGAAFGLFGFYVNTRIFRSERSFAARILTVMLITALATSLYITVFVALNLWL